MGSQSLQYLAAVSNDPQRFEQRMRLLNLMAYAQLLAGAK